MMNTKFVVKLNRVGTRAAEYVQRVDRTSVRPTTKLKLALAVAKFTAEYVAKSIDSRRCKAKLVSVQVRA